MNDYLISIFIDNEMTLDEKVQFVQTVRSDSDFTDETLGLLKQEKLLRSEVVDVIPPVVFPAKKNVYRWNWARIPVSFFTGLVAAVLGIFILFPNTTPQKDEPSTNLIPYRFVIYQPGVKKAEIIGSFTNWQTVPMNSSDDYWQITLDLPAGEHRFAYILDGRQQVSDPTIPIREKDDFGGENSILEVQWSV
jgi:hypothetical protein